MRKMSICILMIILFSNSLADRLVFPETKGEISIISVLILKKAYEKLGYEIEFVEMSNKRALVESNKGKMDGEVHRIKGIDKKYPNLIMIEIPINYFELRLFSKNHELYVADKSKLIPYKIGAEKGIILYENYLEGLNSIYLKDPNHCFTLLEHDRVDMVLATYITGVKTIKKNRFFDIKVLQPTLKKVKLYHYLNEKNKDLVPKITAILREMHESGEIEKIRNGYIENIK